jgi:hypothetical protein
MLPPPAGMMRLICSSTCAAGVFSGRCVLAGCITSDRLWDTGGAHRRKTLLFSGPAKSIFMLQQTDRDSQTTLALIRTVVDSTATISWTTRQKRVRDEAIESTLRLCLDTKQGVAHHWYCRLVIRCHKITLPFRQDLI